MSCFVMKPEAISKIATYTAALLNMGYNYFGMEQPDELAAALHDCRDIYGLYDSKKVYEKLYALNLEAYNGRYSENNDYIPPYKGLIAYKKPEYKDGHYKVDKWMLEMSNRLSCFRYQCCEDATYGTDLYNAIGKLIDRLNSYIVQNMKAWHDAKWGE